MATSVNGVCTKHRWTAALPFDECPNCVRERLARPGYICMQHQWGGEAGEKCPMCHPAPSPVPAPQPESEYADGNPKSVQGAKKYSLRLLPLPAEVEVCRALEDGLKKYGAANWRKTGVAASVYVDAAQRHIKQFFDGGQDNAADSNVHNLGHAMACLAIIIDAQWNKTLIDDRPMPCRDTDLLLQRELT